MSKKGIYLGAYKAYHENYDIDYNDVKQTSEHINVIDDMLNVDLSSYDYIIATPPCNYWSRANYRRETSRYAQLTKHLLIDIIDKLIKLGKPFIVENVRNNKLMDRYNLLSKDCYIIQHGRHTYWTNVKFDTSDIEVKTQFKAQYKKIGHKQFIDEATGKIYRSNNTKRLESNTESGDDVHQVIERFLKVVHNE